MSLYLSLERTELQRAQATRELYGLFRRGERKNKGKEIFKKDGISKNERTIPKSPHRVNFSSKEHYQEIRQYARYFSPSFSNGELALPLGTSPSRGDYLARPHQKLTSIIFITHRLTESQSKE